MTTRKKTTKKPSTVAERRAAQRASRASEGSKGPTVAKVEIDLTKPAARKQLAAQWPRPKSEDMIPATPELERAALEYVEQRDVASLATEKKEIAGNLLCNAIQDARGITGDGWEAVWTETKGSVDWSSLAKDLNIAEDVIEKYRGKPSRTLKVTETATDGDG
jgi:hypothetical protein